GRPRGLPRRPRGADRHQPPRAGATRSADGPPQLALLLDRDRREIRGDRAEPDRHLSPARHRPLCLSGRCAPARRPAPCRRCRATHPKAVEATLRGQSASIRSPPALEVGKNAARLPLTVHQGYEAPLGLNTPEALLANVRVQLQALNNVQFSNAEWLRFVESWLDKPSDGIVEKTRKIHDDYVHD